MDISLTPEQGKRLKEFSELPYGIRCWNTDVLDRGLGKTTLLRVIALVESQDKPVTVFVPNNICVREFVDGMPQETLKSAKSKHSTGLLDYGKGIWVWSCTDSHRLLGCHRECILVDDARKIDPRILEFHGARARKMFICS